MADYHPVKYGMAASAVAMFRSCHGRVAYCTGYQWKWNAGSNCYSNQPDDRSGNRPDTGRNDRGGDKKN